jgi:4-amino-4-deoxy-L-arabinose transferase-like glycosyltransferase
MGRDLIVLIILVSALFGFMLGSRPLSVPDEGRYVEIPREMVVTGDWLTPRLNRVKYFEKPPLFYWIEAFLIKLLGLTEWSARIGPALLALFGCLTVYYAGARLFGRRAGILSAIVLSTSFLYFALSRLITMDMPVSVLLTAALLSFLLGTQEPAGTCRRLYFWGFYAFAALATLTKGLIGIVFPGMIIFFWMLILQEWRVLRTMHLISGLIIFLFIAAPWHILAGRANPEFFHFYFVREHFQRYLTKVHHHYKPAWFYVPILIGGMFPWSVFLLQAVRHAVPPNFWKERKNYKSEIFLLLWVLIIFLFFSASSSKLIPYLLPVLPPCAIILGKYLSERWYNTRSKEFSAGLIILALMASLLLLVFPYLTRYRPGSIPTAFVPYAGIGCAILLFGIVATSMAVRKVGIRGAVIAIAGTTLLFLVVINSGAQYADNRSLKPLALAIKPILRPGDEVAHYRNYYQDLPVYLERRMTIVDWKGELDFGTTTEDTSGWIISEAELWKRWQAPTRIFLIADRKDADAVRKLQDRAFFQVAEYRNTVILSNSEIKHELSSAHHTRRAAERRRPDLPEGRYASHRPL